MRTSDNAKNSNDFASAFQGMNDNFNDIILDASAMNLKFHAGALLIFARAPRVGEVKSRLARTIGAENATSFYRAMLRDTLALARHLEAHSELLPIVVFTPDDGFVVEPSLGEFWTGARVAQKAGDLGQRMSAAVDWAFARGAQSVFLVGTDAPDLPASLISEAVKSLQNSDAVAIPAPDGGFVLWGTRHSLHDIFAGVDWRQSHTLAPVLGQCCTSAIEGRNFESMERCR